MILVIIEFEIDGFSKEREECTQHLLIDKQQIIQENNNDTKIH